MITFENVSLQYDARHTALRDINIQIAVTGDDAVGHTPLNRGQEGRILRDILKGKHCVSCRRVLHSVQRLHQTGAGRGCICSKGVFRNAVHQIGLYGEFHGLLGPVRL